MFLPFAGFTLLVNVIIGLFRFCRKRNKKVAIAAIEHMEKEKLDSFLHWFAEWESHTGKNHPFLSRSLFALN